MQANTEAENTEEKIKIILSPQPRDNADVFEVTCLLKMHMIYAYQIKSSVPFSLPVLWRILKYRTFCCSVARSCLILSDPMDSHTPVYPVLCF